MNRSDESLKAGEGDRLLFNLSSVLEALPSMQDEFRRWFFRYVPSDELRELEGHEASTFRHLWAVAYNFIHAPTVIVAGGAAALERGIASKRRDFLRHLKEHVGSVLAGNGMVTVLERTFIIDGNPSLVIVCDHDCLNSIENARSKVVQAIWTATQVQGWQLLEWHPLSIEWPRIFVTHTIKERALFAGGTSLNTSVFFGTVADFEVHPIHLLEMPVNVSEYRSLGLRMWEAPLLPALINFQGAFLTFLFTLPRFYGLMKVATAHELSEENLQRYLNVFSKELSALRRKAHEGLEDVIGLLNILPDAETPDGHELIPNLQRLCTKCLFIDTASETDVIVTPDIFEEWATHIEENIKEANEVFVDILNRVIESC